MRLSQFKRNIGKRIKGVGIVLREFEFRDAIRIKFRIRDVYPYLDTVFTDSETSTLTYQVSSALELVNGFVENRNLFFESKQDQFGLDTLFIQALDDGDFEVIDSIIVDVLPINDPPEIINSSA